MPEIRLKVTLNLAGELDVEDIPDDGVPRHDEVHVITWYIDPVALPDAYFERPLQGVPRAFTWIDTPPWYVFKRAEVPEGKTLRMEDRHIGSSTVGRYIYMLRVRKDSSIPAQYYTTTHTPNKLDIRTTKNPVIINR